MQKYSNQGFDLKGLRVLVTRSKPMGEVLCQHLEDAKAKTVFFPAIDIRQPIDTNIVKHQIAKLNNQNWLIFMSPHTVFASADSIREAWPVFPKEVKLAAVGAGTAKLLQQSGFPEVLYPQENWTSEGLLDLPEFHEVKDIKIAVVRGEGGREWLADTLAARGAIVSQFLVYRRSLPEVDSGGISLLLENKEIDAIVSASSEGLRNLKTLLTASWAVLQDIPLIVISQRMFEVATQSGFHKIYLAKNVSHNAIIETLSQVNK